MMIILSKTSIWLWIFLYCISGFFHITYEHNLTAESLGDKFISAVEMIFGLNYNNHQTQNFLPEFENKGHTQVCRRGQWVKIGFKFRYTFNESNRLYIRMYYGLYPKEEDGSVTTFAVFPQKLNQDDVWHAWTDPPLPKQETFYFYFWIPVTAPVGRWRMAFGYTEPNGEFRQFSIQSVLIIVLFNPWSPKDSVYLPDESDRQEYIFNEFGIIFSGTEDNYGSHEWYFDQFLKSTLYSTIHLLERARLTPKQYANPVEVVRILSQLSNSNDESGVLTGRWKEPYAPYTPPWEWMSTEKILNKFTSDAKSVRFGQCWVYAALITSMCRTLGIPARPVTNYGSGHDTDSSLTIDRFFDGNGEEDFGVNSDSIWNYHVWTEVWMSRPDLSKPYDVHGWQAVDGTPQEQSKGLFRMGPANVAATKVGDVTFNYDQPFLYGEVNADTINWIKDVQSKRWKKISVDTNSIGLKVYTKQKGSGKNMTFEPEDITLNYKFEEGSKEERESIQNAGQKLNISYIANPKIMLRGSLHQEPVDFKFLHKSTQPVGKNLQVLYKLVNNREQKIDVDLKIFLRSVSFNGNTKRLINKRTEIITLSPKKEKVVKLSMELEDEIKKNGQMNLFQVTAFGTMFHGSKTFIHDSVISFKMPTLLLEFTSPPKVNKNVTITVSIKNPFSKIALTKCHLISKSGKLKADIYQQIPNIEAGKNFNYSINGIPDKVGDGLLILQLDCYELFDIRGHLGYNVELK